MHATEHKQHVDTVKESALKVDSGRKIPCRSGESNLPQQCAGPTLYQLSYIPSLSTMKVQPSEAQFIRPQVQVSFTDHDTSLYLGRGFGKNEVKETSEADIIKVEFLAVDKACKAVL